MLELRGIAKDYYIDGKPFPALKGISLCLPDKGFVAILGPSGCGKTTLLNIIGGLDRATSGDLLFDGKSTKEFKDSEWDAYRNEKVGFVFQSYNLIEHETILSNVETGLLLNGVPREERQKRARKALAEMGLAGEENKKPNQLSGGQMQRVALARAIANDPEIILADEPTGSLDSGTSVQVLDILKDISRDRLVVMVTHNREMANRYADRLIEMKDGLITSDSQPLSAEANPSGGAIITKKTSMSFGTAFLRSFRSIMTKKTRTILTVVATSFGIIGIALVLALSNGFQLYVGNVESSLASSVPITVSPAQYSYSANAIVPDAKSEYPSDGNLVVYDDSVSSFISHRNNYGQDYFQYIEKAKEMGLVRDILYNRIYLSFNVLTQNGSKTTADGKPSALYLDQYSQANLASDVVSSVTGLPATVFHELYGEEEGLSSMYDCIYGRFPTGPEDLVLITDRYNRISFATLKALGIFANDDTASANAGKAIPFSDLVYDYDGDASYKPYYAYLNSDWFDMYYANGDPVPYESETLPTWKVDHFNYLTGQFVGNESTQNVNFYRLQSDASAIMNDETGRYHPLRLRIVGVLRPSKTSYVNLMPASIGYLTSLKNEFADDLADGGKGANLAKFQAMNYYIYRNVGGSDSTPDGLAALNAAIAKIMSGNLTSLSESSLSDLLSGAYRWNNAYRYRGSSYPQSSSSLSLFLRVNRNLGGDFREGNITDLPPTPTTAYDENDPAWSTFVNYWEAKLTDPSFYATASKEDPGWGAMDFLAYYNSYATVSSILIFPSSIRVKGELHAYLDAYNEGKPDAEQILYTDIMSTFTDSLGTMLNVISIVLIVFSSISLVVSSVMTGIITYVSVIERTKEIGVLRACGARKRDIARLFEAECAAIGLGAGGIGVAFTYAACLPINQILDSQFPGNNLSSIAQLDWRHALLLILLAVVLALISGAIPAFLAAKKDPVIALRSE